MNPMKKILLLTTGGTIACAAGEEGLEPHGSRQCRGDESVIH